MTEKFGLTQNTIDEINAVFSKYSGIEQAILYGSRATGNFKAGSDIDLTLIGNSISHQHISTILNEFDESNMPYLFDLSILSQIENPDLVDHIKRVGKIFYQRLGK